VGFEPDVALALVVGLRLDGDLAGGVRRCVEGDGGYGDADHGRRPALVAHDVHQQGSEGLHVGLDTRARAVDEENAVQLGNYGDTLLNPEMLAPQPLVSQGEHPPQATGLTCCLSDSECLPTSPPAIVWLSVRRISQICEVKPLRRPAPEPEQGSQIPGSAQKIPGSARKIPGSSQNWEFPSIPVLFGLERASLRDPEILGLLGA
jgi:hypothetical protein